MSITIHFQNKTVASPLLRDITMYQIDKIKNEINPLSEKKFSELKYKEREHLQEWLAKYPVALGEDLLIIQKEFDGFDNTRERLDLLALDKKGNLVLIENKLDDSGRDVVWQSLKYASYCSALKKADISRIYQDYLDRYEPGSNSETNICDFLENDDFSEVILNSGTQQRIKLVAAHFRKEVTSTVLWLLQYGLDIQCYKTTIFTHESNHFLNLEQIIPPPEAADFMIGVSEKEKENIQIERGLNNSQTLRKDFWTQTLSAFEQKGIKRYQNISPSRCYWLNAAFEISDINYTLIFSKKEARVGFTIERKAKEENKQIFDMLMNQKDAIEADFGAKLEWCRLDNNKYSSIQYRKAFDGYDRENWSDMINWLAKYFPKFEATFEKRIEAIRKVLR